jgi:parvulin-like peptidyl-prolyl isomerase
VTPFSHRLRALVLVLMGVLLLAACGSEDGGGLRPPAARVDGVEITDADVSRAIPMFEFLSELNQAACGTPIPDETADQACARFVLGNLIQRQLVETYATDNDLAVTTAEVDEAIAPLSESLGGEAVLIQRLGERDLTLADFHEFAGRLIMFGHVQEDLAAKSLPDDELKARYQDEILSFTQIHTAHVLLETRAEAEDIAARATPRNFAQLATEFSTDPSAAQNGGDLGLQPATQFVSEYAEAAAAMDPGDISEPVQSEFGWHVIHLIDKQVLSFEEAREQLVGQAGTEAFTEWLADRLATAEIEVNPRYGRFDPATGDIAPITSTSPDTRSESPTG